jgi:hypothetical protein
MVFTINKSSKIDVLVHSMFKHDSAVQVSIPVFTFLPFSSIPSFLLLVIKLFSTRFSVVRLKFLPRVFAA